MYTMIQNPKTASVTELRQNATALLQELQVTHEPIFILQNSKKVGVMIDEVSFQKLLDASMDQRDYELAETALHEKNKKRYTWKDIEKMRSQKL